MVTAEPELPRSWHSTNGIVKMPSRLEETVSSNASAVLPPTVCSANDNIPLPKCDPSLQHHSSNFFGALLSNALNIQCLVYFVFPLLSVDSSDES